MLLTITAQRVKPQAIYGLLLVLVASFCQAEEAAKPLPNGRDILEKVADYQRSITDSAFVKSRLSSCQYGIKDRKITCVEDPRVKLLEAVGVNYGTGNKDTKSVTIVVSPASEKGIGMLNYTFDEPGKDNETWLYLSALGKVKRIASGNSEDDSEPASLFGSEFTTEDLDAGKLSDYNINVLGEGTEAGRPIWKIETLPNPERARKTRYARSVLYIDQERYVSLRAEMYDKQNKEIKRLLTSKVDAIKGVWTARSQTIMNLVTNRLSNMVRTEINPDIHIPEDFLTQRTLTDVAFRETTLEKLRAQIQ